MPRKVTKKKLKLTLKSSVIVDDDGQFRGGGIRNEMGHISDEMWVEFMEDPVMDHDTEQWGVTGRPQVHLGSTRRALEELGVFLLALAHYHPPEPGYTAHIELTDREYNPALHLVVHLPVEEPNDRPRFAKVHNFATAFISEDGEVQDMTLPALHPDDDSDVEDESLEQ